MSLDRKDSEWLEKLLELLSDKKVAEFTYEEEAFNLHLRFAGDTPAPVMVPAAAPAPVHVAAPAAPAPVAAAPAAEDTGELVRSPMVGTFYSSPSPDAPPFVAVGAGVNKGQTLCIIEAMKLMNEIESEVSGVVVAVLAKNGQPVQFGDPLFRVKGV
ncbi:MAG: acetyl-CoA carboxylase biotin carboxyl carrier protein [Alphaproteobacteria bacterium]|nr:acetyl-CoA carboxylase biotin carboxyl carrier protein [Alphaproteobacteria bacterium]